MKRFFLLSLLGIALTNVTYAQLTSSQESYLERKILEAEAKQKKTAEEAKRKEREKEQRHEQQRKQHEANFNRQMNNLNSVSAEDFLNRSHQQNASQQQENFNTQVNRFRDNQQTQNIVATQNKENINRSKGANYENGSKIGTHGKIGENYTADRYEYKRAGFVNTQQRPQARVPVNEYRSRYSTRQPIGNTSGKPAITNLHRPNTSPRVSSPTSKSQKSQNVGKVQTQQKRSIQNKVAWKENGKLVIDSSKPVYTKTMSSSSSDLKPVDAKRIDYATEIKNITVYNVPQDAYSLSDNDNKITSANVKPRTNETRTEATQYQKMRQDALDGFSSFDNRQKWEDIYGYGYHKTVTTSRTVVRKR